MLNAGMLDDGGVRAQAESRGVTHSLTQQHVAGDLGFQVAGLANHIRTMACVPIGQSQVVCGWARKFEGYGQRAREKSSNTQAPRTDGPVESPGKSCQLGRAATYLGRTDGRESP